MILTLADSLEAFLAHAKQFETQLAAAKSQPIGDIYHWYPYNTIASVSLIAPLLTSHLPAFQAALSGKMLDIGCADGDLSYLFASLGCQVAAVDLRKCNFNWMMGVRTLGTRLNLPIEIHEMDVDSGFDLNGGPYGLALLLGILYHLKNPFLVLETLARNARYCLLSTRVAAKSVAGTSIREEPLAYLLDHREANNDPTNYWIFSHTGLKRIAKRSGWRILDWRSVGPSESNPAASDADERMFMFLRSQLCSAPAQLTLLSGWTEPLPQNWAWTEKKFSFEVRLEEERRPASFLLGFLNPEAIASVSPITVHCTVNGHDAGTEVYKTAGDKTFEKPIPASVDHRAPMQFEFTVEHGFDTHPDPRSLGVIMPFTGAIRGTGSRILFWLD
jgi:hypothetical protein